jgi:Arc/MetJ-type ribon-helix-helix transcriptional regulator
MTNVTVPVDDKLFDYVERAVKSGKYASKADLMRAALLRLRDDDAFAALQESLADKKAGKVYKGDLKKLVDSVDL